MWQIKKTHKHTCSAVWFIQHVKLDAVYEKYVLFDVQT